MIAVHQLMFLAMLLAPADAGIAAAPSNVLHYFRGSAGDFKPESDVIITRSQDGLQYQARTIRARETTTIAISFDSTGKLQNAVIGTLAAGTSTSRTVTVRWRGGDSLDVSRALVTEFVKIEGQPIITTTPDWSDVWQLVQRYDQTKGGKQEFAAVWVHPRKNPEAQTVSIEQLDDSDTILVQDHKVKLRRYLLKLRPGEYLVWTDHAGKVIKIVKNEARATAVVLDGYQEATANLGPR
jgi:hypothetical protein